MKNLFFSLVILLLSTSCIAQKTSLKTEEKDWVSDLLTLTETHICNPAFLETSEWKTFVKHIKSKKVQKLEGLELVQAFNTAAKELTFSHFYLDYTGPSARSSSTSSAFELKEINPKTVHLNIRKFNTDAAGMIQIIQEIAIKNYENLIIDLRENPGGTLDAAVILGHFLSPKSIDAGTYITRAWFDKYKRYPTLEEIQGFPFLKDFSYEGFREIGSELAFRMLVPGHNDPTFQGKVFVLTSSYTASACEPFVYVMKQQKVATLVGEKTRGAMLSAQWFKLSKEYSVFIPTNDYMTADGTRIDQVGVSPDKEIDSEKALDEVLKMIK